MLNGKQKRHLRALGNTQKALFQIGKEGLSINLFDTIKDSLEAHELVKISVLKTCSTDIKELSFDLARNTKSEVVQIIGRTILLYRVSKERRIELP
ncbi:MAG: ribosome assembly RNA-binding protein YhbY [Anaerorhabdus sp.]